MADAIGGQAVIEGVMMLSAGRVATAVRKESGQIILNVDRFKSLTRFKLLGLPFVRGIVSLFEMMFLGMKMLTWSANQQDEEESLSAGALVVTFVTSIAAALGLFVGLPYLLTYVVTADRGLFFNIIDGIFRLLIFLVYVSGISLMSDVSRIFQYHGAEHKTVNCHEKGMRLTPKNVLTCSRIHPRCGTSLIVFVLGISIVLFSIIKSPVWYINIGLRILLIPVIAGASYELIKWSSRRPDNSVLRLLIKPGLWTQELTTREPSAKQCEVAIKAIKAVL
jgi:uncharacterized protein YqhQ